MSTSLEFLRSTVSNPNIQAAMKVIRHTEGTSADDGYSYVFGSTPTNTLRFTDFSTHPHDMETHNGIRSDAAGAYQIMFKTFTYLCDKYGFTDFTPETQDLMFCAILDSVNCLSDVSKGFMLRADVLKKLANQWASLPMSPYGQPTHSVADVRECYLSNGGNVGAV